MDSIVRKYRGKDGCGNAMGNVTGDAANRKSPGFLYLHRKTRAQLDPGNVTKDFSRR